MKDRFESYLLELRLVLEAIDPQSFSAFAAALARPERLFVGGVGRTGALMRAFAARLAQLDRLVHVALEPGCPEFGAEDILVLGSGSGATRTLLAMAEEAERQGTTVFLLTSNMLGPLKRCAQMTLYLPPTLAFGTGTFGTIQPGQTAFEQALLLVLDALAEAIAAAPKEPS